ncbi:hypothetical protein L195_g063234, partial [Trifolium pratense]
ISAETMGICRDGDGDRDKYSLLGMGMEAKYSLRALWKRNGKTSSAHSLSR